MQMHIWVDILAWLIEATLLRLKRKPESVEKIKYVQGYARKNNIVNVYSPKFISKQIILSRALKHLSSCQDT